MKKAKKTIAGMESLFEIRQYDMKNSCFKLQGGRCMDLREYAGTLYGAISICFP